MDKQDKSKTLKERLEVFQNELKEIKKRGEKLTEDILTDLFEELAKKFLYGGYISVSVQNGNKEVNNDTARTYLWL